MDSTSKLIHSKRPVSSENVQIALFGAILTVPGSTVLSFEYAQWATCFGDTSEVVVQPSALLRGRERRSSNLKSFTLTLCGRGVASDRRHRYYDRNRWLSVHFEAHNESFSLT
ncbi:hypothetical protein EVAR_57151_1 [Eumeta japonica]|uniref:Uncharacterized protein n=1 Tax=Eumeta variegata TaxID=151549 RepID=A0A4C1YUF5_EUMVA|nr:hypothetical protein EVAR_57151_1 [Eumeta japonica]